MRKLSPALAVMIVLVTLPLTACVESPPQVVSLNPNNGSTNVAGDLAITIVFDHPVDQASVLKRFSITPPLPGCNPATAPQSASAPVVTPCRVSWLEGGTKLILEHRGSPFAPNTQYIMRLAAGFVDSTGVANSLDHQWQLTSGTAPLLTGSIPADGAQAVSVDTPVVLSFSTYMAVPATAASVILTPPVPDIRVVPNSRDHGRFVVLPGRLLRPDQDYTLTVGESATDEHGLHLGVPGVVHFRTGSLDPGTHAVVLAGRPAEPPSEVILASLTTQQPGDTPAAATVRIAPRCRRLTCGSLAYDDSLEGYSEAVVSPGGTRLAVVVADNAQPAAPARLVIEDLPGGDDRVVARGARNVSWSPDSTRISYQEDDGVHILTVANGGDSVLPPGAPLDGPVEWSPDGETLVLPVLPPGGVRGVDLANAALRIRYPLPNVLPAPLTRPVLNPGGDTLAVRRLGSASVAGTWILHLTGANTTALRLGPDLTPVDWIDGGTLLAVADNGGAPELVRVSVADGDRSSLSTGAAFAQIESTTVAPSGRQIAFLGTVGGVAQAFVENADGSNATPLTAFAPGTLQADGISFGG